MKPLKIVCALLLCLSWTNSWAQEVPKLGLTATQKQTVEEYKSLSYRIMGEYYTSYTSLFNLCQQFPDDKDCGDKYHQAESQYRTAKSINSVFNMLIDKQMTDTLLPFVAYPDVSRSLIALERIDEPKDNGQVSEKVLNEAVNQWMREHQLPQTQQMYMLQYVMIRTDANKEILGIK